MRKLSTIQEIGALTPIENADKIETAHIRGWTVVVGKGEFEVGQKVLFFEIDSMLPLDNPLFAFLESRGVKMVGGLKYHRLRTMKLRGQISQGLILPIPSDFEVEEDEDFDYSERLEVLKYEPALPTGGMTFLKWPEWISHTDEERIQSLDKSALDTILSERDLFEATEKIDGTSCTIWARLLDPTEPTLEVGVCSRNYGILSEEDNLYARMAKKPIIEFDGAVLSPLEWLRTLIFQYSCTTAVLQGEIFGLGVQGNPLGMKEQQIRFFNLFIDGKLIVPTERYEKFPELEQVWVPVHHELQLPNSVDEVLTISDGLISRVEGAKPNSLAEGIVWRHISKSHLEGVKKIDLSKVPEEKRELVKQSTKYQDIRASFKAISNKYLLKHDG